MIARDLRVWVVATVCFFRELGHPVPLDPLQISARFYAQLAIDSLDFFTAFDTLVVVSQLERDVYSLSMSFKLLMTIFMFSSLATVMKNLRCTMSYFPFTFSGNGLKMSSLDSDAFGPYQLSGGYCSSEMSNPST